MNMSHYDDPDERMTVQEITQAHHLCHSCGQSPQRVAQECIEIVERYSAGQIDAVQLTGMLIVIAIRSHYGVKP